MSLHARDRRVESKSNRQITETDEHKERRKDRTRGPKIGLDVFRISLFRPARFLHLSRIFLLHATVYAIRAALIFPGLRDKWPALRHSVWRKGTSSGEAPSTTRESAACALQQSICVFLNKRWIVIHNIILDILNRLEKQTNIRVCLARHGSNKRESRSSVSVKLHVVNLWIVSRMRGVNNANAKCRGWSVRHAF